jgi:hypothetical protein
MHASRHDRRQTRPTARVVISGADGRAAEVDARPRDTWICRGTPATPSVSFPRAPTQADCARPPHQDENKSYDGRRHRVAHAPSAHDRPWDMALRALRSVSFAGGTRMLRRPRFNVRCRATRSLRVRATLLRQVQPYLRYHGLAPPCVRAIGKACGCSKQTFSARGQESTPQCLQLTFSSQG